MTKGWDLRRQGDRLRASGHQGARTGGTGSCGNTKSSHPLERRTPREGRTLIQSPHSPPVTKPHLALGPWGPPEGRVGGQPYLLLPTVPRCPQCPQRHAPWQQPPNPGPQLPHGPREIPATPFKGLKHPNKLPALPTPGSRGCSQKPREKGKHKNKRIVQHSLGRWHQPWRPGCPSPCPQPGWVASGRAPLSLTKPRSPAFARWNE